MRPTLTVPVLSVMMAVTLSCSRTEPGASNTTAQPAAPPAWAVKVEPLASPSGPASSDPQLTASDRGVILSWVEQEPSGLTSTLKFAERTPTGWSAATTVASGEDWFVSYADPPSVMRLSDGTLVASWLTVTDIASEASDLHLSYSQDEGKTWSRPFLPHHDGTKSQHAFASMFELPGRGLGVVWLDGRGGEDMSFRSTVFDANWRQSGDAAIDARVCECCGTSTAMTSDGVIAAYRDRSDKEIRDIYVSRFENGKWTSGAPVHKDEWLVDFCPINGPSLAARGRQAVAAWFTVKNDVGQAYAAFSNDAGRAWDAPIRIDDQASRGRVDVELLEDGSAVVTWVEFSDGRGVLQLRRVEPSGSKSPAIAVAGVPGSSSSGFPRLARRGNELVFAWTESAAGSGGAEGNLSVHTAVARLPQ